MNRLHTIPRDTCSEGTVTPGLCSPSPAPRPVLMASMDQADAPNHTLTLLTAVLNRLRWLECPGVLGTARMPFSCRDLSPTWRQPDTAELLSHPLCSPERRGRCGTILPPAHSSVLPQ